MKTPNQNDFPFADLLGLKPKENFTEKQKLGLRLLEIAKEHPTNDVKNN